MAEEVVCSFQEQQEEGEIEVDPLISKVVSTNESGQDKVDLESNFEIGEEVRNLDLQQVGVSVKQGLLFPK